MSNKEEFPDQSPFAFKEVNSEVMDEFVKTHGGKENEKHWVMYDVKWSKDYPLFTFSIATCLAPVLINRKTGEVGLGHLAYLYDSRFPQHSKGKQEDELEKAINKCRKGNGWELYLYGGQPLKESGTDKKWFSNHHYVIDRFNQAGVQCFNRINSDVDNVIDGIIVDPVKKEILVSNRNYPQIQKNN